VASHEKTPQGAADREPQQNGQPADPAGATGTHVETGGASGARPETASATGTHVETVGTGGAQPETATATRAQPETATATRAQPETASATRVQSEAAGAARGETAAQTAPSDETERAEVTRKAGRGGLFVAFAKVYFMLIGLLQQIALARVLGLDAFGAYSTVATAGSITYNPVVTTSIQGLSRAVAQSPDAEQPAAIRRTLKVQSAVTVVLAVGFFLLAGPVGHWLGAPHLVPALRIMTGVLFFYGLYAPLVGVVNGQKRFHFQAGFDIAAATLRTVGLVACGWWFAKHMSRGVEGAVGGFVVASCVMCLVALAVVGLGRAGRGGPSARAHLAFIAPLLLGQVLLNLLLQADQLLLRRFASESAIALGLSVVAADPLVGAYRATQLFAFLPYQLLVAVTFIIFPFLATAYRDRDRDAVARYVRAGVRLAVVLAGAMVSVTSGLPGPLLRLVFKEEFAVLGARSMQVLTLGFGAFAVFAILTTALNSLKRERASAAITSVAFGLVVSLCFLHVRGGPFGAELLWRTAVATSVGIALATLGAAYLVKRSAGAVLSPLSLVRAAAAMAISILVGRQLPSAGKLATLGFSLAVVMLYGVLLIIMRELGRADVQTVKTVLARRKR
jgi:stage V sporulation protein B